MKKIIIALLIILTLFYVVTLLIYARICFYANEVGYASPESYHIVSPIKSNHQFKAEVDSYVTYVEKEIEQCNIYLKEHDIDIELRDDSNITSELIQLRTIIEEYEATANHEH